MQAIADFDGHNQAENCRLDGPNRFVCRRQIRFGHCDPAGIVYYPQYTMLLHEVQEDWFQFGLGIDYHQMICDVGLGLPMVDLQLTFQRPSRPGDRVDFIAGIDTLGRSSMSYRIDCHGADGVRIAARLKVVTLDIATHKAVEIPALLRQRLEAFREGRGIGAGDAV